MVEKTKSNYKNYTNQKTLVNIDLYLKNGIHIGTKYKNGTMKKFIFKSRSDKLNVMDVKIIDKRIQIAINFLARYDPKDVVFVSRKKYALPGINLLEKNFGYKVKSGRFIPGTFTNPESEHFMEPKLVFIVDPNIDRQAILEAKKIRVPIVALATTSSNVRNIDLVVPFNNKGRKSVALFFWLLNRQLQLANGYISKPEDFAYKIEDFIYNVVEKNTRSRTPSTNRFGRRPFRRRR